MSKSTQIKKEPDSDSVKKELELREKQKRCMVYLGEFKALLDACGEVSRNWHIWHGLDRGVAKLKIISSAYGHDARYYKEQYTSWRSRTLNIYDKLTIEAKKLDIKMPDTLANDVDRKDFFKLLFLNDLVFSKEKREAFTQYLASAYKRGEAITPEKLEEKFKNRLEKRVKKAEKAKK